MSCGTHDSTQQVSLPHIPVQPQLVILREIRNTSCLSLKRIVYKMFYASETLQPNERKNQKLLPMYH